MLSGLENPIHLLLVLVVVMLLFGARRLPELGRSLGTGLREFKASLTTGSSTALSGEDEGPPAEK